MGRLYQRITGGNYYADYDTPDGRRIQRSLGTKDKAVARERLRQAELAATPGARGKKQSLVSALEDVIVRLRGAAGTRQMYEVKARMLVATLGDVDIGDLTLDVLEEYVTARLRSVKAHTITKELIVLRRALKLANRRGRLPILPSFPELATDYKPRELWLTPEQLELVLAAIQARTVEKKIARQRWIVLAALGGMRAGEVERLDWSNVMERLVRVPGTKTKDARRTLPIAPALAHRLALVPSNERVGPVVPRWTNVRRDLHAACDAAGVPRVSPNDLRRTFSSWLVQQGVPLLTVAALLGHSSTRMVERVYGRLSADNLHAAIAAVPAFSASSPEVEFQAQLPAARAALEVAAETRLVRHNNAWKRGRRTSERTARRAKRAEDAARELGACVRCGAPEARVCDGLCSACHLGDGRDLEAERDSGRDTPEWVMPSAENHDGSKSD